MGATRAMCDGDSAGWAEVSVGSSNSTARVVRLCMQCNKSCGCECELEYSGTAQAMPALACTMGSFSQAVACCRWAGCGAGAEAAVSSVQPPVRQLLLSALPALGRSASRMWAGTSGGGSSFRCRSTGGGPAVGRAVCGSTGGSMNAGAAGRSSSWAAASSTSRALA